MKQFKLALINVGFRSPLYPLLTPPLGLLALAAYVRSQFNVNILLLNQRLNNASNKAIVQEIVAFSPDVVGLSCLTTSAYLLPDLVAQLRASIPGVMIALGGAHASSVGPRVMETCRVDVAVAGEGEISFGEVLTAWQAGADYTGIPGLIWRNKTGEIIVNPGVAKQVPDLDTLPPLAYDLVDMKQYWRRQSIAPIRFRRYISLMSSRGCPYRCFWCHNNFGKHIRMHSPARVAEDVERFQKQFDVSDFEFFDDNFNFDAARTIQFCEEIHQRNINVGIAFPTGVRGDLMTEEMAEALASAGMYMCCFALDTASPRLQKYTGKNMNLEKFVAGLQAVSRRRIYLPGFFMMGFPTETEEELQLTMELACRPEFSTAAFYTVTPFPGTTLYEQIQKTHPEKLAGLRYDDMDLNSIRVNLTDLPDEVLFAYQRRAINRFFLDPKRLYRLVRDHPSPLTLPSYLPIFLYRATKGIWSAGGRDSSIC